jgi:hypothetical protein
VVVDFVDGEFRFTAIEAAPAPSRDGDVVEGEVIEAV